MQSVHQQGALLGDAQPQRTGREPSRRSRKILLGLAKAGKVYAIYLGYTETTDLDLTDVPAEKSFDVHWYDPRIGGELQQTEVTAITGGGKAALGPPPADPDRDWVVLVTPAE